MQLEVKDKDGVIGTIELPIAELMKEVQDLGSASVADPSATEALKVEVQSFEAQLKEKGEEIAKLGEKLTAAEGKTMGDFKPEEKANFVIAWAEGLALEDKAIFAEAVGIPIARATAAEVAEGKPDPEYYRQFGCRYCEHLVTVSAPRKPWVGGCQYKLSFPDCGKWELWSGMLGEGRAEVAEALKGGKPAFIKGKTTLPGYKLHPIINLSIRESQKGE